MNSATTRRFASLTAAHHQEFTRVLGEMFTAITGVKSTDVVRVELKDGMPGVLVQTHLNPELPLEQVQCSF